VINLTLKKSKIIGVFIIFGLCFLFHFMYDFSDNLLFSILFPVNESIWEHMKLIFYSYVLYTFLEYLLLRKKERINNLNLQLFIIPLIGIILYLIIFVPIYSIIGENMILSIGLLFIVICIEQFLSYKLSLREPIIYQKAIGYVGIIIMIVLFAYLTYNPLYNDLFIDKKENTYGIIND